MKYIIKFFLTLYFFTVVCSTQANASIMPQIIGEAGISIDVETGEIIYAKNIDKHLFPASITKLMTAIILAENSKPQDIFKYSKNAKDQEPFTISYNIKNITVMDKITANEAMDAMLISSANDIAYMIAENVGGNNYKAFIDLMNKKVQSLNLKNTNFVTANGLHDDNHYSTAYDLSVIAREALKYPWIMSTLIKKEGVIKSENGVVATFKNTNKLLLEKGYIGGKTGYTSKAGRCLLSYFEMNGRKFVGVVLKSDYDEYDTIVFKDMKKIITWSYITKKETFIKGNSDVKNISSNYYLLPYNLGPVKSVNIPVHTKSDIQIYKSSDKYEVKYFIPKIDTWKLDKDIAIGIVTISSREVKKVYSLYPSISKNNLINSNKDFYIIFFGIILILNIALLSIIFYFKKKFRK